MASDYANFTRTIGVLGFIAGVPLMGVLVLIAKATGQLESRWLMWTVIAIIGVPQLVYWTGRLTSNHPDDRSSNAIDGHD